MKIAELPPDIRDLAMPKPAGSMAYRCLSCDRLHPVFEMLYVCPDCRGVLLLEDQDFDRLKRISASTWRRLFDCRKMLNIPAVCGVYRFHEFIGPVIAPESVLYLGEGGTPMVEASVELQEKVGLRFFFKNDGQNPSASFKDRGMASALSYVKHLLDTRALDQVLAVCASTGDTSASAALYAARLFPQVKCAVLLPHGKVTPQQLGQPLGCGAAVFEIPGVFDDCMKVVEALSERFNVILLNSKNAWRILGQESFAYEVAQDFDYDVKDKVICLPIGNAGNITAVMNGFVKFFQAGVIDDLPDIVGVQSSHADPVFRYYQEPDVRRRRFEPVCVKPSVAQAAMIGNPVSMPRVIRLAERYDKLAGRSAVHVVRVEEQDIMDWMLCANRYGNIVCTQGGESLAGLVTARRQGLLPAGCTVVCDATAHALKFALFQEMYFEDSFDPAFGVRPRADLVNRPRLVRPAGLARFPAPGTPLKGADFERFVEKTSQNIADTLGLSPRL